MKNYNTHLLLLLILLITSCQSKINKIEIGGNSIGQKMFFLGNFNNKIYLTDSKSLFILQNNIIEFKTKMINLNSLEIFNNQYFLATKNGLFKCDFEFKKIDTLNIPCKFPQPDVNILKNTKVNNLLIAVKGVALFTYNDTIIKQFNQIPYVNSIAETKDSSVWVATNSGLLQFKDMKTNTYSEEIIHQGFTVPDNIIENLYIDDNNFLWVTMPNLISIVTSSMYSSGAKEDEHPMTLPRISNEFGEIKKVFYLKNDDDFCVLITSNGLYLIDNIKINENIHQEEGLPDIIEKPSNIIKRFIFDSKSTEYFDAIIKDNKNLLVSTNNGLWEIPYNVIVDWNKKK